MTRPKVTEPTSLKIVAHGVSGAHGLGVVTLTRTSDWRTLPSAVGLLPGAPCSELITRKSGERPVRTTSPHETAATATRASAARPEKRWMPISFLLMGFSQSGG